MFFKKVCYKDVNTTKEVKMMGLKEIEPRLTAIVRKIQENTQLEQAEQELRELLMYTCVSSIETQILVSRCHYYLGILYLVQGREKISESINHFQLAFESGHDPALRGLLIAHAVEGSLQEFLHYYWKGRIFLHRYISPSTEKYIRSILRRYKKEGRKTFQYLRLDKNIVVKLFTTESENQ